MSCCQRMGQPGFTSLRVTAISVKPKCDRKLSTPVHLGPFARVYRLAADSMLVLRSRHNHSETDIWLLNQLLLALPASRVGEPCPMVAAATAEEFFFWKVSCRATLSSSVSLSTVTQCQAQCSTCNWATWAMTLGLCSAVKALRLAVPDHFTRPRRDQFAHPLTRN